MEEKQEVYSGELWAQKTSTKTTTPRQWRIQNTGPATQERGGFGQTMYKRGSRMQQSKYTQGTTPRQSAKETGKKLGAPGARQQLNRSFHPYLGTVEAWAVSNDINHTISGVSFDSMPNY